MKKILLILSLIILAVSLKAQNTFATYYFDIGSSERSITYFGRLNSPRAEAMGRGMVAVPDGVFSSNQNPALLTTIDGIEIGYSYASPYYCFDDGKYNNFSVGYNYKNLSSIALNLQQFQGNDNSIDSPMSADGSTIDISTKLSNIQISLAQGIPLPDLKTFLSQLSLGINFNIIKDNNIYNKNTNAFSIDAGLNYLISDNKVCKYMLGTSLTNLTKSEYGEKHDELMSKSMYPNELPQIGKIGLAIEFNSDKYELNSTRLALFKAVVTGQFQYVFNTETYEVTANTLQDAMDGIYNYKYTGNVRKGYSLGTEIQIMEIINLRAGYYTEDYLGDFDYSSGKYKKQYLKEFTYGFGLQAPIARMTDNRVPLNISFDMTVLPQPSYSEIDKTDWGNLTSLALKLNYLF